MLKGKELDWRKAKGKQGGLSQKRGADIQQGYTEKQATKQSQGEGKVEPGLGEGLG